MSRLVPLVLTTRGGKGETRFPLYIDKRWPYAAIEVLRPRVDGDEPKAARLSDRCAHKATIHVDNMGLKHCTTICNASP